MKLPDVIPLSWKIGAALALVGALYGWHAYSVSAAHAAGVKVEKDRRDGIDAINSARAKDELAVANGKVLVATQKLASTQADLQKLQTENDHEKAISSQRQSDLLAGRERLRILTTARNPAQAGPPAGAGAATVDQGAGAYADIDPGVAAGLDGIRERHNEAVRRLTACVAAYDAVKAAADSLGP
ncbi:MAG: hypothetical protein V4641_31510 [Pseudomonadota bacterium]